MVAGVLLGGPLEAVGALAVVVEGAVPFKPGAELCTLLAVATIVGAVDFAVRLQVAAAQELVWDAPLLAGGRAEERKRKRGKETI